MHTSHYDTLGALRAECKHMAICAFDGCDRAVFGWSDLCKRHHEQRRSGKELKPLRLQFHGLTEYERFFKLVEVLGPSECWNWKSCINHAGYGVFMNAAGKSRLAHREAWRLMIGHIPGGLYALHKCDNPKCVNPSHLFLGTQKDNLRDMWDKGRARPGVSRGQDNGCALLTEQMVREILASSDSGVSLSERYGVSQSAICDVRRRRTWKHISQEN